MQYQVPPYPSRPCSIAASIPARDHMCERPVPARLQFARDQPIGWIGSIVLPEGPLRGAVEMRTELRDRRRRIHDNLGVVHMSDNYLTETTSLFDW